MAINSLKALNEAPETKAQTTRGNLISVDPQMLLEEEGFNTRGSFLPEYWELPQVKAGIQAIADAYQRGDYVPPMVVKVVDGKVYVRDGHRRRRGLLLAISQGAEIRRVPLLEHKGDEAEQSLLIGTSNDGEPLSPLDRAVLYGRFVRWGWKNQEIATRMNRSIEHVRQALLLLELPLDLKMMIQIGEVRAHYVLELYREHGGEKTLQILQQAKQQASAEDTPGDTKKPVKITKKMVQKQPSLGKKFVKAMQASMLSITNHLDNIKPANEEGRYILELSRDEVDALYALRDKLTETKNVTNETPPRQKSLLDN